LVRKKVRAMKKRNAQKNECREQKREQEACCRVVAYCDCCGCYDYDYCC
jgi:hypothetical protein